MRFLLLLVACGLLFLSAAAAPLPADTAVLRIDSLAPKGSPTNGLLLKRGWRYQVGDNPQWARADFNDSAWDTLNPTKPRQELPPSLRTDISWLRLRFRLADTIRQRVLLQALGYGAWEIYLNGRLLQRQGTVQANPTNLPDIDRPQASALPPNGPTEQVLAIRFAPWQSPLLSLTTAAPQLLNVLLRSEAQVQERAARQVRAAIGSSVIAGIFGLLTLLHVAFFRYYPAQRANLYFAFFAGGLGLHCLVDFSKWALTSPSQETTLILNFASRLLFSIAYIWAVRALYALFGFRPGWLYKGLWIGFWVMVALILFARAYSSYVELFLALITFVELLRLTGRALRQRQRGAWLVGAGFALCLIFLVVIIVTLAGSTLLKVPNPLAQLPSGVNSFISLLLYLAPALGISLYLAREFALDSQLLQVKLSEVERLSAQTIAQEQDKQALLAQQNETLEQQVQLRTGELQRSLTDLRATQAQLIQKEKMASAHEIQNPLNFVTNFSDLSSELVAELREEQAKGVAADAALQAELFEDLTQNLDKIGHHGRRAAGIVKGMLEHSQTSAGERRPTNLNGLTEEYLRLAYQGLRAKDKSFNVELTTDFATELTPVTMVGPDVGRVLLNLFTNAFYAVRQRQRVGEAGYQPTVRVSTQQMDGQVHIRVQDNGTGMSPAVREKIFQPFFTTKPPGEGTGLGLSLSYDIIAQGHGGKLAVESQEGYGSEFTITLPV